MEILDIRILPDSPVLTAENHKVTSVEIKIHKGFWGTKWISVHPVNYGPTNSKDQLMFLYFVDDMGKKLDYDISSQINNFLYANNHKF